MFRKVSIRALLIMMWVVGAACQRDPFVDQYTTSKPREETLAGTYIFSRDTITWGEPTQIKQCRVELRRDGTFAANNIPRAEFPGRGDDYLGDLIPAISGTWRINSVGGREDWRGRIVEHWGVYFECSGANIEAAGLTGRGPQYGLIFGFGDPDRGKAVFLKKQP